MQLPIVYILENFASFAKNLIECKFYYNVKIEIKDLLEKQ